ncbi:MAG: hypothetical protein FWG50_11085, partial [Kiritimatiellaeota bacterium]|nr:hypothetical protein [Kiritimatiellota bacterium]
NITGYAVGMEYGYFNGFYVGYNRKQSRADNIFIHGTNIDAVGDLPEYIQGAVEQGREPQPQSRV